MDANDKRILKLLCFTVIQLVKAVNWMIANSTIDRDEQLDLTNLSILDADNGIIETLQEHIEVTNDSN